MVQRDEFNPVTIPSGIALVGHDNWLTRIDSDDASTPAVELTGDRACIENVRLNNTAGGPALENTSSVQYGTLIQNCRFEADDVLGDGNVFEYNQISDNYFSGNGLTLGVEASEKCCDR